MSRDVRSRLAAQAAAAGYPPDLLALIAHATLPRLPGWRAARGCADRQVTDAVEVLAQAGYRADTLAEHIAEYQRRHGSDGASALGPSAADRDRPLPPPGQLRALAV